MFRLWAKEWKNNHLIKDMTVKDNIPDKTRTHKIFDAITTVCHDFDLPQPIWLDSNIREFKNSSRTRFTPDSFIEAVPFDYLEIQVIEED